MTFEIVECHVDIIYGKTIHKSQIRKLLISIGNHDRR